MNLTKTIAAAMLALLAVSANKAEAKGKVIPCAYMFGFSASFTDSVVYFTNVQKVDSVWYDKSSKALLGRENYSLQLKNYLAGQMNMPNRTCLVVFGLTRKDAEKKFLKMKRLYTGKSKGGYEVRSIDESSFKFLPIDMGYVEDSTPLEAPEKPQGEPGPGAGGPPPGGPGGPR